MTMPDGKPTFCFIGFGEAGQAIAAGLREAGVERIAAWDILFPKAEGERLQARRQCDRVRLRFVRRGGRARRRHHRVGGHRGVER